MTSHYIDANLTEIITEARSNVGNFSKTGGNGCLAEHPLYTPKISSLMDIFYDKKSPNYLPKRCLQNTPRKCIHECILLVLLCCYINVETVLSASMNDKKIFSDTKTNPNPPLSRSDRGPCGAPGTRTERISKESPGIRHLAKEMLFSHARGL
jgi:hypothetical protein